MMTGVYTILNKNNNKVYVGSSCVSIEKRLIRHKKELKTKKHVNRYLQRAFDLEGDNFEFEILHECEPDYCVYFEQYWINMLDSYNPTKGYNLHPNARSRRGYRYSDDQKEKLKGRVVSDETRKKIGMSSLGRIPSESTKLKLSKALKGKPITEEKKKVISLANKRHPSLIKPIFQYSLDGNFIKEWGSIADAVEALGGDKKTSIIRVCKGKHKTSGGFIWRYKNNPIQGF